MDNKRKKLNDPSANEEQLACARKCWKWPGCDRLCDGMARLFSQEQHVSRVIWASMYSGLPGTAPVCICCPGVLSTFAFAWVKGYYCRLLWGPGYASLIFASKPGTYLLTGCVSSKTFVKSTAVKVVTRCLLFTMEPFPAVGSRDTKTYKAWILPWRTNRLVETDGAKSKFNLPVR